MNRSGTSTSSTSAALTPAALALLSPAATVAGSKPHIVHFMADDLGWNDLGRFNGGLTITPAIDGLIQQGVILQRFHTFKVCAPSRASTLSGRYPFNVGFYEMPRDDVNQCLSNTTLLPALLKR